MLSTNQGLSALDLKEYDHCMLMFKSTERLRVWLLGRQSAFRDQESLNIEVNACWQQTMDGILRKVGDLYTELEDLEKRVLEEFMS